MDRYWFSLLLACGIAVPAALRSQATLESSIGGPTAVAVAGNFSLTSTFGLPGAEPSSAGPVTLLHGWAPQFPLAATDSGIASGAATVAATGTAPVLRWQSDGEATGVEFRVYRAVEFAGGWIVDTELSTEAIAGAGAGSEYTFTDPVPYTFGDAERVYLIEISEPGGGTSLSAPISLYRDPSQANDAWTIL